jgi:hypothetical protein
LEFFVGGAGVGIGMGRGRHGGDAEVSGRLRQHGDGNSADGCRYPSMLSHDLLFRAFNRGSNAADAARKDGKEPRRLPCGIEGARRPVKSTDSLSFIVEGTGN